MDKKKAAYTEGVVSIVTNTSLFVLKLWAGIVSGSIALTADAWHTLSDSLSSVVVIVAAKLSSRKPDKEHPFGHGRWEQIAALFIAFLLAVIAYDFMKNSILSFRARESATFGTFALVATIVSIVVKEGLAQYAFWLGRKTDNVAVKADGWHHRTDALSSVVVLIGILLSGKLWWTDSVLGAIVSLMLFYATWEIAKEAIAKLLGEKPSPELVDKIEQAVQHVHPEHMQLHHFHIHNYVNQQELTFHIRLDKNLSIERGHSIATEIEKIIKKEFGITATIHVEPLDFVHPDR
ncbi:MAG TPA: cation diffusion facilitator family transporter [Prolixibacteraceae bacterium]|nr:cation diffusion facilitator family transporter [Prolixibacteraceae bacterium]